MKLTQETYTKLITTKKFDDMTNEEITSIIEFIDNQYY